MDVVLVVAVVTAFAALVTGGANLVMILEQKRHRMATSRPVLKPMTRSVEGRRDADGRWTWGEEQESNSRVPLTIQNFGTGPAINIEIRWTCDKEQLIRALKHFDPYNQLPLKHERNTFHIGTSFHVLNNQESSVIQAIPAHAPAQPLVLPMYYIDAYEKFIELNVLNRPASASNTPEFVSSPAFPSIYLTLSYEEINGGTLVQQFSVLLGYNFIQTLADGTAKTNIRLDFKEESSRRLKGWFRRKISSFRGSRAPKRLPA